MKTAKDVVDEWTAHRTKKYRFYMELVGGEGEVEWTGLKLSEAKTLYRLTEKHCNGNITRTGWGEME